MTRQASTPTRCGRGVLCAVLLSAAFLLSSNPAAAQSNVKAEVKDFVSLYTSILQRLYTISAEAEKAKVEGVEVEGAFGVLTLGFELAKREGKWLITYMSQY